MFGSTTSKCWKLISMVEWAWSWPMWICHMGKCFIDFLGVEPGITLRGFYLIALLPSVELFLKALGLTISLRLFALWRYYQQGARFAKWRAVIKVDSTVHPSSTAILENAHGLARYAQICQVLHIHGPHLKTMLWQCKLGHDDNVKPIELSLTSTWNFGRDLVVLHTKISMSGKFSAHAWSRRSTSRSCQKG